jgi:hypothetical protein
MSPALVSGVPGVELVVKPRSRLRSGLVGAERTVLEATARRVKAVYERMSAFCRS